MEVYSEKYKLRDMHGAALCYSDAGKRQALYLGRKDALHLVDEHTLFQMASLSKLVASIVFVQFMHDKKIALDEKLCNSLPIKVDEKTTMKSLLSHSAGINVGGFAGYNKRDKIPTLIEVIEGLGANSLPIEYNLEFGKYSYSGGGYCLAQYYIENISGKVLADLADDVLFKPLGLKQTTYNLICDNENCACGYYSSGDMVDGGWHIYPEGAAAGLWSNASEYIRILEELVGAYYGESEVISQSVAKAIFAQEVDNDEDGNQYCLGCRREKGSDIFWHDGSNQGFKCEFVLDLSKRKIVVLTTNDDKASSIFLFAKQI